MMAIPLSAIRKYTPEIIALSVLAIVLGAFWSIVDTYQPSYLLDLKPTKFNGTLNATVPDVLASTVAPIVDVDIPQPLDAPSELSEVKEELDEEFAIGAPKILKFALTGKLNVY